jgi:hypothetical protein
VSDFATGTGVAISMKVGLAYADGGREKYSTSTGVPRKIFGKLEPAVCRASVTMV